MTTITVVEHAITPSSRDSAGRPEHYSSALARRVGAPEPRPWPTSRFHDPIEARAGFKYRAARHAWRQPDTDVFVSMSEQVAFPLALYNRGRIPHIVLAHNLITSFKRSLHRRIGWLGWFDHVVVFSQVLADHLTGEAGLPEERVHAIAHPTDHRFFAPMADCPVEPGLVVATGREHRDYQTLIEAMLRLPDARAVIVANSPWAKRPAAGEGSLLPPNVTFTPWLSAVDLRHLMARAAVIALPLEPDLMFGAGLSGLGEAKAMGRPLVATSTPGIADHLDPESTVVVPPSQPDRLSEALAGVLDDPKAAEAMGRQARALIERHHTNDQFAECLSGLAQRVGR